jgi:hypothetical protein
MDVTGINLLRITPSSRRVRSATSFCGTMLLTSQFQNRLPECIGDYAHMHPDHSLRYRGHHGVRRGAGSVAQARRRQLRSASAGRSALLAHQLGAGNAAIPRNRQSRWKSARWLVALRTGCIMSEVSDTAKCPCAETSNIAAAAFIARREQKIIRHNEHGQQ